MLHKFAVLSGLVLSATCMVLHQPHLPIHLGLQYDSNPNYNFAYEVNDAHTGDIKSQQESRRGDTVLGQYSLLQPDGVRRTVDYRANDHTGFLATVNNEGRPLPTPHAQPVNDVIRHQNLAVQNYQAWPTPSAQSYQAWPTQASTSTYQAWPTTSAQLYQAWPTPSASPSPASTPVAISRSSITQTFAHGPSVHSPHNPWA
ncbi:hypothetical protein PYW07_001319 [Mythimna separata]|uniref:Uncharacterized protein n=1 Tax=Mythimna separata TaxID=271217 RepID=A0AAD7YV02_MYTSE|nr:hypothetical protein PYW07_001319 [Mythimna separata]